MFRHKANGRCTVLKLHTHSRKTRGSFEKLKAARLTDLRT